jgi:hypothetical protein
MLHSCPSADEDPMTVTRKDILMATGKAPAWVMQNSGIY